MGILEKYQLPGSRNKWFQVTKSDRELPGRRLRIAFLVNSFPLLSETFVLSQITGLIDRGHTVDIYATKYSKGEKYHDDVHKYGLMYRTHFLCDMPKGYMQRAFKLISLIVFAGGWRRPKLVLRTLNFRKFGRSSLSLYLSFTSLPFIREKPYDILHCQFGFSGPLGLSLKQVRAFPGKLLVSFRGIDLTENLINNPGMYDNVFKGADCFLPVSENFRQKLIKEGCCEEKIKVHYSGIDCSRFKYKERTRNSNDVTRIGTVGRLVEKKGIAYAIRAMQLVIASGHNVSYTIMGDGPLRGELQKLISLLRLEKYITITGWLTSDEIIKNLEKAHIFLAPSITSKSGDCEGIPNASKEAMAMGMPVISTWHSGNPELIEDGVSGFLVPERDIYSLSGRIGYLVDHPEIWPSLGRAGREVIESKFEINSLNDDLLNTYFRLTGNGPFGMQNKPMKVVNADEEITEGYKVA
ncbi:MAG: glycosyltransferase [Balneolales bacterium]